MFDNDIFGKFTKHLKSTLQIAGSLAKENDAKIVKPIHLLRGILNQPGSLAAEILHKNGLREKVNGFNQSSDIQTTITLELNSNAKKIITKMINLAFGYNYLYVGTEHLLMAILSSPDDKILQLFKDHNISTIEIKKHLEAVLKSSSHFSDLGEVLSELFGDINHRDIKTMPNSSIANTDKTSLLSMFATDLTTASIQKNIDPVVGREIEIDRLAQILSRRRKNNPLLLGDPGVGKTAIVEGLAKKITTGDVPEVLRRKKILSLDLGLIVAGTMYRGEFEGRLKSVLDEIKNNPDLIVFIDEIHNIIGAGSTAAGTMDAANIIKPALARGEIRCIGATTQSEYHKHIESDPALERRFQTIQVNESSAAEALLILQGLKKYYENFHGVNISKEAIQAAVDFSVRYLPDRFLPDKAIDLIDEAASRVKIKIKPSVDALKLRDLHKKIAGLDVKKTQAIRDENYDQAIKVKAEESALLKRIDGLKTKIANAKNDGPIITRDDIGLVVSQMTDIPLSYLTKVKDQRISSLSKRINNRIIGQAEATDALVSVLKRAQIGLSDGKRPLGNFLFLGPSGVGKTETAKVLAEEYFGSSDNIIRIDMSEFTESFNISKLIGAPAGYVGYREGGKITDAVRHRPYSVVLFDEIEKGHPDVFNLLLQILDEGYITDAEGRKINFQHTVVILTSNIASEKFDKQASLGFSEDEKVAEKLFIKAASQVMDELEDFFKPELINRLDKIIVFNPLTKLDLKKIVKQEFTRLHDKIGLKKINLNILPKVIDYLAVKSWQTNKGAREIKRNVAELVEKPLVDILLSDKPVKNKEITVFLEGSDIKLKI